MTPPLELLWIGFQTLCDREIGCLDQKDVRLTAVPSMREAAVELGRRAADIVVLSLTGDARELAGQISTIRAGAPGALVAVVVCHGADIEGARAAGADHVTALESEGDLVCAPVLRWIDQRRGADVIDLRGASRRRRELERENARLEGEVEALRRRQVRDPASQAFGRGAFAAQLGLAAELIGPPGLALVVIDAAGLDDESRRLGDFIVGGVLNRITGVLREIGSRSDIVGRIGPDRFALALLRCDREGLGFVLPELRAQLEAIELPGGARLRINLCGSLLDARPEPRQAARRLLARVEEALDARSPTRVTATAAP